MTPKNKKLREVGESEIIQLIDDLLFKRTKKRLIRDDAFYSKIEHVSIKRDTESLVLCLNSDMLVSTTDVPQQMNYRQMGYKAVIMNSSDLIVKGVSPQGIIISLGLPPELRVAHFKSMLNGIIDACESFEMDYIGGDINETQEIIINPTVFGVQKEKFIIHREPINPGDVVVANGKFGLTGVGLDILLNKSEKGSDPIEQFSSYKRSIKSVLSPHIGSEGIILAQSQLVNASIDSSDGLLRSLHELMRSNPQIGFEITLNNALIDNEATQYSKEFDIPLKKLIFTGAGEEFIQLFIMSKDAYKKAKKLIEQTGGHLFSIGKVINETEIYGIKKGQKFVLSGRGYEHFS
ncbi:MAG: hypothetical protein EU541_02250 [Promethearchaeota archaeon]|nr:MAG: hypothetical protein EU541_02250 [Candidatus Lokiarchaeota archaeon]